MIGIIEEHSSLIKYEELLKIRDYIYRESGIYFFETRFDLLSLRIEERMNALGIKKFSDYYFFLRDSEIERRRFFDAITVNETYFFREFKQIEVFFERILPHYIEKKNRIKIVSAGCSSGAEPYTIAIFIKEKYSSFFNRFEIVAFDISSEEIRKAKEGLYNEYFFRNTPEHIKKRYFIREKKGYRIKNELRNIVYFYRTNLFSDKAKELMKDSFLILCRNVLIYFNRESRERAVEIFYESLSDGGYLILGHSEVVFGINKWFNIIHYPGVILYRKEVQNGDRQKKDS